MPTRILPAAGDADAVRSLTGLLGQLPEVEPVAPATDSTQLVDALQRLAADSVDELPEVVIVHERIGPVPALELIRDVALRFPATGVILATSDTGPGLFQAAMDHGARGVVTLPLGYEELASRVQAVAHWSAGVRRHLGGGDPAGGGGGTVVAVCGAKGGVGTTVTAINLALAAQLSGRSTALLDMDLQTGDVAAYLDVQFRRSVADLATINDISPRVLADAVFRHDSGVALLLAPADGERGEEITDRAARQILDALRSRYEVVVVDCGAQLASPGAAAVELADLALLVTTPDVIAVRGAKRAVRLWDRLQIRKPSETTVVVNRHTRGTEIQPALVRRITGTAVAGTTIPAGFRELQGVVDAGRLHTLEERGAVRQALWRLAGELGIAATPTGGRGGGRFRVDRRPTGARRHREARG
ncbi:AAA family ATPase [Streptomyces sp. WMMC905]|uniref:AAA family ATPase n=1 Tax=Streptomyces sp. WMMC905 TaxID=3404123 RepID=UPI003B9551D3